MKKTEKILAFARMKVYDPIGYSEFLRSLGNISLNKIEKKYGGTIAEDVSAHFIDHPSEEYLRITGGA